MSKKNKVNISTEIKIFIIGFFVILGFVLFAISMKADTVQVEGKEVRAVFNGLENIRHDGHLLIRTTYGSAIMHHPSCVCFKETK